MLKQLILKFKTLFFDALKNDNKNSFCFLPKELGYVKSLFLRRIFSGIRIEQEQINILENIPENAIIIFTTKYKSKFDFLFAHTRHKEFGLPIPQLAFDYNIYFFQPISRIFKIFIFYINYIIKNKQIPNPYNTKQYKEELENSSCAFLSLIEKKDFYLRFIKKRMDPLQYLIEIQKKNNRPIYIVPQLMFFDRNPIPAEPSLLDIIFGNSQKPGSLRKILTLLQSPGKVFVELSQPLNLLFWLSKRSQKLKQSKHQALALRRYLLLQHNRHRHTITGPTLKSREEVKEAILTNREMRTFMKKYAQIKKTSLSNVRKKADSYVNEIAARYNLGSIKIMSFFVNWIVNSTFDGAVIDKEGLNKVKQMSRQGPLILVPCHKSHVDYLVLSYVLYNNNMPCPHVAAGKNLSFWPLGSIFRSAGAFFIRRSFKGQELYKKVLSQYVCKLLEEGFNIEMFIEGGRSRTGKLLTPKLGFISILLKAFRSGVCKDIIFVPTYIGYDRIIEEHSYIHETGGGNKSPENLSQIVKARKFLKKKRYGKIYINFNEPISLRNLISNKQTQLSKISKQENIDICKEVGRQIITAIDKETVITPHGLTAAAILNLSHVRFTCKEIINIANSYLFFAIAQNAKIADTLVMSPDEALKNAFEEYKYRKIIEVVLKKNIDILQELSYTVKNNKRSLLEFYKNNSISYFVNGAIVAITILEKEAFQFSASDLHKNHKNWRTFFRYEFSVDLKKTSEYFVRKTIKAFIDDAMLMPHKTIPDTYNITSSGYQKLKFYATFLKPYFESYMVVLQFIRQNNKGSKNIDIKEKIKKIQLMGSQMQKRGEIDLIESVSKSNYLNGIKLFSQLGIHCEDSKDNIKYYHSKILKQLKLINK